jgi:hypothetical protein
VAATTRKRKKKAASTGSKAKLGSGARFKALKTKLGKRKGVSNPGALAAYIGRKKYGAAKMSKMSAAGRKRKGG